MRGSTCCSPQGTYFATVDIRSFGETDGLAFCRSLPHRCGVVAVPSVVFYDDTVAGAPARALRVLQAHGGARRGLHPLEELGQVIVAGIQHDIVWERARGELHAARADDRASRRRRRAPGRADRDVLDRLFDEDGPDRGAGRRAERGIPRRRKPASTACGCARRCPSARRRAITRSTSSCSRRPTATCTGTPRSIRSPTGASTSTMPREPISSRSRSTAHGARSSSVTTCVSPTSSGRSHATTDCYVLPANWPASRREHWMALLRARAIENQAYVVGVNRVGDGGRLHYCGDSMIIDPFGEILARPAIPRRRSPPTSTRNASVVPSAPSTRSCRTER